MAKGYVIVTEAIHDPDGMLAYMRAAGPSLAEADGTILAVDRNPEAIEGDWHGTQTVVIEFESVQAARDWYASATYQAAIPLRQAAADCNVAIVAGIEPPRDS